MSNVLPHVFYHSFFLAKASIANMDRQAELTMSKSDRSAASHLSWYKVNMKCLLPNIDSLEAPWIQGPCPVDLFMPGAQQSECLLNSATNMSLFHLDNNVFGGSPELWANSLPINYSIKSNQIKSLYLGWKHSWKEIFVTFHLAMSADAVRRCVLESNKRYTKWRQTDDIRASSRSASGYQTKVWLPATACIYMQNTQDVPQRTRSSG